MKQQKYGTLWWEKTKTKRGDYKVRRNEGLTSSPSTSNVLATDTHNYRVAVLWEVLMAK